jgi:hypothetical protein
MAKTKFKNAQTIVTEDFLNSLYGGLEGTTEGSALSSDDPRLTGHVHDGLSLDGHASKIDLVSHVTGQLTNTNLADDSVLKRNVYSSTNPLDPNLIPYYETDSSGTKNYFLNLGEFNLQTITDNGFETTNKIVIGKGGVADLSIYNSNLTLNTDLIMDSSGNLSKSEEYPLTVLMSGQELFEWNIKAPEAMQSSESYSEGVIDGSTATYRDDGYSFGLEQRLVHDDFGYVSFVGNETASFDLRVVGVGAENISYPYGEIYGSSNEFSSVRSYFANPSLTFWYEYADENNENYGSQDAMAGVSAVKGYDEIDGELLCSDLIFSIRPDSNYNVYAGYEPSITSELKKYDSEDDWPLVDVVKVSRYGNMEVKRGNSFSSHSESMINIKETFGIKENIRPFVLPPFASGHVENRNIASIRMEPIISNSQEEGSNNSGEDIALSKPLVANHNYIDLVSITDTRTTDESTGRALSAQEDVVAESHVFKFDRYFIDKNSNGDTHRALLNNTEEVNIMNGFSLGNFARHSIPSVNPNAVDDFYTAAMIKVNIMDGDTPRTLYVPTCYPEGIIRDQDLDSASAEQFSLTRSSSLRNIDLDKTTTAKYFVNATDQNNPSSSGYFYPLYTSKPSEPYQLFYFSEFQGVAFYMLDSDRNIAQTSPPSTADYPGITAYVMPSNSNNYYI